MGIYVLLVSYWLGNIAVGSPTQSIIDTTFTASFYALPNTTKVRIIVSNKFNQRLKVELQQGIQGVIYQEVIGKRIQQYNTVLNLEDLPFGAYHLSVSCEHQTIRRTLYLDPPYTRPYVPTRILSIDNNS